LLTFENAIIYSSKFKVQSSKFKVQSAALFGFGGSCGFWGSYYEMECRS
jgi:hypothetical protein